MTHPLECDDLLVKFVYGECTIEEIEKVRMAVLIDDQAAEQLAQLLGSKEAIESINYSPKKKTVENILDYSRGLSDILRSN